MRVNRGIWITIAVLLGLLALAAIYIGSGHFNRQFNDYASRKSGRAVSIEHIQFHWSSAPVFIFNNVEIKNADWSAEPLMFSADRIELALRLLPLLRGRVELPFLQIDRPRLLLEKNQDGKANWQFTQNPAAEALKAPAPETRGEIPLIGQLKIADGAVTYRDAMRKIETTVQVSTVRGEGGKEDDLTLQGKGNFAGKDFAFDLQGGSALQLRESDRPYPFRLNIKIGATEAKLQGAATDPLQLEGLDIRLDIKGQDAAELFPITGIALLPTPPYRVSGHLSHQSEGENAQWVFSHFSGAMGDSDLSGDLVWQNGKEPPYLKARFVSENLNLADLSGFIGADDKPADNNRVLPDKSLDISRLMAMNADIEFRGTHVKTPDVLDNFTMIAQLRDGVLKLQPLTFGQEQGRISADITVEGKAEPPKIALKADFTRLSLERFFKPLAETYGEENVSAGLLGGRAELQGTGKSLRQMLGNSHGTLGFGVEGGRLSRLLLELIGLDLFKSAGLLLTGDKPVAIRCIVGDFTAQDGILSVREFLIDTKVTAIRGSGTLNMQNEQLDLKLKVHPKDSTLVSARAPILVSGTLGNPKVGPEAGALAKRGAAAAALGALLTPVGALLAFIEPSMGKDSNCTAYLQQLQENTGSKVP